MRHALLTEQWFPQIGGSINLFDNIYRLHFPPDERVRVVAGALPGDEVHDRDYGLPVTRFNLTRYPWMRPESALEYARMTAATVSVCVRHRIEVLHCGRVLPEALVAMAVGRALGIPYVVWVHGEEVSIYVRYAVKRRLMPRIFAGARAVFCNSSFTRERALAAGAPEATLHVVHPGVDAHAFAGPFATEDLVARWGLAGKRVLLTIGRLTRRKGHDVVLQAVARLRDRLPDLVYLVLSDGELEAELKRLARELGVADVVRFVGPVPTRELPRHYALADVFVMANRTLPDDDVEGFGMVFLEASAAGLPVIGGRSGGVVDAVSQGESGLLVNGSSVQEVAEAIAALMDDPPRRRAMGARGRAWVRETFSWERAARRVRDLAAR